MQSAAAHVAFVTAQADRARDAAHYATHGMRPKRL